MWETGRIVVNGVLYSFEAKVYEDGSPFGINGGPISKLYVRKMFMSDGYVLIYDRGWNGNEPQEGTIQKEILDTALAAIEIMRKK